jgi:hypothetical protein
VSLRAGFMRDLECHEPEAFDALTPEQREAVCDLAVLWFRYDGVRPRPGKVARKPYRPEVKG